MARGESISSVLARIDGRGYKAYSELRGTREAVGGVKVWVVRVQGDPFAPPSVVRLEARLGFHAEHPVPVADLIYRRLWRALSRKRRRMGEGHSGFMGLPAPSPAMLRRSGVEVRGERVVARIWVGLPSRRRRVLGRAAEELLLELVPRSFVEALRLAQGQRELRAHVEAWLLQEELRKIVVEEDAVAFIGDGSILPRRCGSCYDPLPGAIPFRAPRGLSYEAVLSDGRSIRGMLLQRGFTLVMGAAFHGKTTLAEAIAQGIYNHVPGDGRELVVSRRDVVVVRAEDGRFITCVDISSFIHDLPGGTDTECFTTSDASGATSTAASLQEMVEAGARAFIIDEDYVATNVLYTDPVAEKLTRASTVTPLSAQARSMVSQGISIVLVSQGSMQLIARADRVVVMENYLPRDATAEAKRLSGGYSSPEYVYKLPRRRVLIEAPRLAKPKIKAGRLEARGLQVPVHIVSPQIVEEAQVSLLASLVSRAGMFKGKTFEEIARWVDGAVEQGFERVLGGEPGPGLAEIRGLDLVYALNRLPGIRVRQAA